jgi:AraC family transcriptional regulator
VACHRFVAGSLLPAHYHLCVEITLKPVETLVFASDIVAFGKFRCPSTHALYRDSGPCSHHTFVFPRTTTSIRHENGAWFVGSPNTASLYNQNQIYTRSKIDDIDASDWFVIADDILLDAIRSTDPDVRPDRPFALTHVPVEAATYRAQRALFENVGHLEPLEIEETVLNIFAKLMASGQRKCVRRRDAVEEVKRAIAAAPSRSIPFRDLARSVEISPFELCRQFRRETGFTLTQFRHSIRLRMALELLRSRRGLTDIALDLGYTSHSHFTAAFRNYFGITPSRYRATS